MKVFALTSAFALASFVVAEQDAIFGTDLRSGERNLSSKIPRVNNRRALKKKKKSSSSSEKIEEPEVLEPEVLEPEIVEPEVVEPEVV